MAFELTAQYFKKIEGIKVDLVMWTYNGASTLPMVLKRIGEVIPENFVNKNRGLVIKLSYWFN